MNNPQYPDNSSGSGQPVQVRIIDIKKRDFEKAIMEKELDMIDDYIERGYL